MRKFIICFIAVAAVLMMGSCAKDYGYAPEYGRIKVAPADAYPGDSLTATIEMLRPGNGVYKGDFIWTIDGVEYNQTIVNDLSVYAPQFGFRAPAAGTHTIDCRAKRLYMSKVLESGQIYSSATAKYSKFTVKSR